MRSLPAGGLSVAAEFLVATGVAAFLLAAASAARAEGTDDRAVAEGLAHQLEETGRQRSPASVGATEHAVEEAKRALERATRLRSAGDEARAKAADSLAREWAETGRDIRRAVTEEAKADELRRKALDAQARVERVHTLIEEEIARVGRLRAQLDEATRAGKGERAAVEVHDGDPGASKAPADAHRKPTATDAPSRKVTRGAVP